MTQPDAPASILLIGDVMLDRYLVGTVDRISPEAPVPVLRVRNKFCRPGGAGNVAANVLAMRGDCALLGVIGADAAASQLVSLLSHEGVEGAGLLASPKVPTTAKTRLLAGHKQLARFDHEDFVTDESILNLLASRIEEYAHKCRLLVISVYAKGACGEGVCRAAIAMARARSLPVVVDPKGKDYTKYSGATVITPNRGEAMAAADMAIRSVDDAIPAARLIQSRFTIDSVVITLGDQGMVVVDGQTVAVIPGRPKQVFDVTGAGDTAAAVLAVMLAEGLPLADACVMANAAGALQVSRIGTSRISRSEVLDALDQRETRARGKVLTVSALIPEIARARAEGKRIGFTNGCFDILHHGHVALLDAAARECDALVVGINSDASVRRLKGPTRPIVPSVERQAVFAGLQSVTWVCEFEEDTPLEVIRALQPDVLIKGGDYAGKEIVGADIVLARGGRIATPLFVDGVSSSNIVHRVKASRLIDAKE